MTARTNTLKLISIVTVILSVFMMSCQKPRQGTASPVAQPAGTGTAVPETVIATSNAGGGGVDGSGGNALTSTKDEVLKALKQNEETLPKKLRELHDKAELYAEGATFNVAGAKYDWPLYLQKLFYGWNGNINEQLMASLEKGKIKFNYKEENCESADGHRDAAASGTYEKDAVVCMSIYRLMRLPPATLPNEIFLLTIHELSHLSGFSEDAAIRLQQFVSENPSFYQVYVCDQDQIYNEMKEMRYSFYWAAVTQTFLKSLDGVRDSICIERDAAPYGTPKLLWLSDQIISLSTSKLKFTQQFFKDESDEKSWNLQWDSVGKTYSLGLKTPQGQLVNLTPARRSNAYCSPKVLMANLIANAEAALQQQCTMSHDALETPEQVKKRVEKEKAILEGEKDSVTQEKSGT